MPDASEPLDLERARRGVRRVERRGDGEWNVQPQAADAALKSYRCPGCGQDIAPGTAHVVAWRADGIFGPADDLAARRHWHTECWRIEGGR